MLTLLRAHGHNFAGQVFQINVMLALFFSVLIAGGDACAADITSGLQVHYKLNEVSGTLAEDSSGNHNDGTLLNFPASPWVSGRVNGALQFDGANDSISANDALSLRITGDITIALWMNKASEAGDWQRLVGKGNSTDRNYGVWEEAGAGRRILFQQYGGGANMFSNGNVPVGVWTHVCCIKQGTSAFIYLNGVLDSVQAVSGTPLTNAADPLTVGYAGFHTYFPGMLDDIRIYNRALNDTEVQALFNFVDVPTVTTALATNATTVDLTFSVPVEAASANNAANYSIDNGVSVTAAVRQADQRTVRLTVAGMLPNLIHSLNVANVRSATLVTMAAQQFNILVDHPLFDGTVAGHYQFEELSGTQAVDSSGRGNHGVLLETTSRGPGKNGALVQGLQLNAANNRVHSTNPPQFKYAGGNMSVAFWCLINPTEADGGYLISKPWNGSGQYNYTLQLTGGRTISFGLVGATSFSRTSTTALSTGAWHHVVATVDSAANMRLYINGAQEFSVTHTVASWIPAVAGDISIPLCIGSLYPYGAGTVVPGNFTVDGRMDDVRIYNRILSAAEIAALAADRPTITISAPDALANESGLDTGTFRISRTGSTAAPLTVQLLTSGTAALGVDYNLTAGATPVTTSVDIPAGQSFVDINVNGLQDPNGEPTETVILTVAPSLAAYNRAQPLSATVNLADDEAILSVITVQANASERGPQRGIFQISRSNNLGALTVPYGLSGGATNTADYQTLSQTVNFAAGQTSVTIFVDPVGDALVEGPETVILTISTGVGRYAAAGAESGTVTIDDRSVLSLQATDPDAYEVGVNPGVVTLTRTDPLGLTLTVPYTIAGTAVAGTDYIALSGSVTFVAGQSTATITITPIDDALLGTDTIVTLSIAGNNEYAAGTPSVASITIHTDPEIFTGSGAITMSPNPALAGQQVAFSGATAGAAVVAWLWAFGDGSSANGQQATHTYAQPGEYEVSLSATLADGTVSIGKRLLFVGTAIDGSIPGAGAVAPGSGGLLVGGNGVTKQASGKLRMRFSRRQVSLSAKLGNLMFDETLGQYSLQGRQGWLTLGPESNRKTYFFVLDGKGSGSNPDVPKMQLSLKKRSVAFTVAEPGLTEFLGTLGATRNAPATVVNVPITIRVADKIFIAFTLALDFKARNDNGSGTLRKR